MLRRSATIAVLAGVLALPAGAHADAYDDVLADFKADGRITACDHEGPDLLMAKVLAPRKSGVPEGFVRAVDKAIATVAEGCDEGEAGAQIDAATTSTTATTATTATTETTPTTPTTPVETVPTTPPDPAAGATTTPPPAGTTLPAPAAADPNANAAATTSTAADDDDGLPPGAIAGIAAGALLLLALLVWGLARFFAWDPVWLARARHTVAEAGWRTSGLWEDFADWLRGGRPRRSS